MERNVIERGDDNEQCDDDANKEAKEKDVGESSYALGEGSVKINVDDTKQVSNNSNDGDDGDGDVGDSKKNNVELNMNSQEKDEVKDEAVPTVKDDGNNNIQESQQTLKKETSSTTNINDNVNKSSGNAEDKHSHIETTKDKQDQENNASNNAASPVTPQTTSKVKVHFVAVGSAPIMKKTKFLISSKVSFSGLQSKLTKMLQLSSLSSDGSNSNHLFLYIQQSFVPSPEDLIGDLNELFSVRGELIIHYSLQEAWG